MATSNVTEPKADAETYRYLARTLAMLRWAVLAVLLILTLVRPRPSLVGVPTWGLVLMFAAYSLFGDLLNRRMSSHHVLARGAALDLPAAGFLYLLCGVPGGLLFVVFFFAVDYAAASLTLRGTLIYTAVAALIAALVDLVLLDWAPSAADIEMMIMRLVLLALVAAGMAVVTRRLTHEQERAQLARDESMRLAEVDQLRAHFISNVSHDLRTPLTALRAGIGMLDSVTADRLRPDERQLMSNARCNIDRLDILISDLLTLNQLEAGTVRLNRTALDLRTVVSDAISLMYPLVQEKGQEVEVNMPQALPVEGDARRLEQVIVNLLDNAHRHTPPGTHITISGHSDQEETTIVVSDQGPGISAADLQTIFGRFHHIASAAGGSGLGLAIAKEIIERHGGRVWVESQLAEGAAFHIALPRSSNGAVTWR